MCRLGTTIEGRSNRTRADVGRAWCIGQSGGVISAGIYSSGFLADNDLAM